MGATTIVAIHDSRANRAGSFEHTASGDARCSPAMNWKFLGAKEADQHLQSARRNTHGSRDNGTKQSAGINENRRRL